ncbi:hypothetical protein [Heyndrickxia acidicola]|uniref:Membrane-spanning protein n=1 Tax=Heyndrickxia acidicola TaxID=209389 RepID=A0ABU6MJ56_9BACI|nr:hypothetical protein [Heyndrickxia acidicola]MED1204702.1 hypothetical protein [Heyndrickxia acidicola]
MNRTFTVVLSTAFMILMAGLAIYYFAAGATLKGWVGIGGILCGLFPLLLVWITKLEFKRPLITFYFVFLLGCFLFGDMLQWYSLGWWDTFLHFISGILLGFTAIALYERLVLRKAGNGMSAWFVFLFVLGMATLGGVLWEIYEFSGDHLAHTHMQYGNTDTMKDLIADTAGGLIIALWSGIRTKRKK